MLYNEEEKFHHPVLDKTHVISEEYSAKTLIPSPLPISSTNHNFFSFYVVQVGDDNCEGVWTEFDMKLCSSSREGGINRKTSLNLVSTPRVILDQQYSGEL